MDFGETFISASQWAITEFHKLPEAVQLLGGLTGIGILVATIARVLSAINNIPLGPQDRSEPINSGGRGGRKDKKY